MFLYVSLCTMATDHKICSGEDQRMANRRTRQSHFLETV
jgi:hypothetical protein